MKRAILLLGLAAGCSTQMTTDVHFLPAPPEASVTFEGETQMGRDVHRLEVRRLAYTLPGEHSPESTGDLYVLYFAGAAYGPQVLKRMEGTCAPLVRKVSDDAVEVYFIAGAHTHIRQRWHLLGATAELVEEKSIEWNEVPKD
ncbi:MAG: hypothetical protein V1873_00220 [Verrucomicrobiota bacterium]